MRKGSVASAEFKQAAVDAVDDLLGGELNRHQAFAVVATNIGVHQHTVRNWWMAAHEAPALAADERLRMSQLEHQVTALTRLNQALTALGSTQQQSS